jgi:diguanylate cyclase (GGDEF)-like protein/PAS domain S-box-containing protein
MIRKFYMFGVFVTITVALGLSFQFSYFHKKMTEETQMLTASARDAVGSEINGRMMIKGQIIVDTADYMSLEKWEREELLGYFQNVMKNYPSFTSIYFGTPDNVMINGSGWAPPKDFDLRTRPWYLKAVEEKKLVFTEAFVNASKDKWIITIAKPVYNANNQLLGVVAGDVSIKNILSIVQDKAIGENGYSFLIDGKGNILAHPKYTYDFNTVLKNINEISGKMNKYMIQDEAGITKVALDGMNGYLAYRPIENTDWKVASFIPMYEYMKNELQWMRIFAITLISSLAVFLILLRLHKKHFITPILVLDKDVQRINIEDNIVYRIPTEERDPFVVLRRSMNIVLDKTQEFLAQLKESENTFRIIFEGSSDAILIMEDDRFIDCNPATMELLGYDSKESIIAKSPWELAAEKQPDGTPSKEKAQDLMKRTLENGKARFEWWHMKRDGTLLPVEVMLTSIVLNEKKVFHILWRDISDRKKMEQKLEYLSYRDQLTSLYNRRFFEEELNRLDVKRNFPLTIVMADVNGLKLINDSFGHAAGDELLKKVAEVVQKGCRADDIVSRVGGDEFVILLPKTDEYEAEQIVKRIKNLTLEETVGSIDISISFGWETKRIEEEKTHEILKKAEDHMYKKKLFEGPSMRGKTINAIINTLHEKNKREEQHSHRVSLLCKSFGKVLGLSEGEVQELKTVGLLHDIGKIAMEESILNKQGKLTDDEWQEMKRHPEIGYRILSTVNDMAEMGEYVLAHHERWDGTGYPKGLKGKEIPLQARIIAIVDAYDAMTSERAYRSALPEEVAIEELRRNAGTQFDPEITRIFIEKVLGKIHD